MSDRPISDRHASDIFLCLGIGIIVGNLAQYIPNFGLAKILPLVTGGILLVFSWIPIRFGLDGDK